MKVSLPRAWWFPAVVGFAAILWAMPFWPSFVSPNEWPRVYQALALVHRGSLAVNEEVQRWGGCEDLSIAADKLYPNKAPGLLPLLFPAAALAHVMGHGSGELRMAYLWGRILASGLPWLLASLLLARELGRRWGEAGMMVAGALAVATPWLSAGALLYSHAWAATCLLVAGLLLSSEKPRLLFAAGMFLGWAAVSEYPTVLVGGLWLAMASWRRGVAVWPAWAGFALPLAFLAAYNWACFGNPLILSSARELYPQFSALSQRGLFGIGWPRPGNFWLLLLSPERGLLFWAPFLLLGLVPPRKGSSVWGAWAGAWVLLAVMAGYPNAHGGWFPGPRYLLSAFPLLAMGAAAFLAPRWHLPWVQWVTTTAFFWGLPAAWLPLLTFPLAPPDFPLAPVTFHWVLVRAGTFMPTLLPGDTGVVLVALLAAAAAGWLVFFVKGPKGLPVMAFVLSLVLWSFAGYVAPSPSFTQKLELAVVRDVYTSTPGDSWLDKLRLEARSEREQLLLYRFLQNLRQGKDQ